MSWQIIIGTLAEKDLLEAKLWYDSQRTGLGDELVKVVHEAISSLKNAPDRHPIYYRNLRKHTTRRFPCKIFYQIVGDKVVVFRVLHSKRDHKRQL